MKDSIHPIYFDVKNVTEITARLAIYEKSYSAIFVLADDGIPAEMRKAFVGNLPAENILIVTGGETVKTISSIENIWKFLLNVQADRNVLLINFGGGAVCDAGGFAASTFKRGIDFVHVPSTLLSMVDASVGGKTGINVGNIKNTVGTFTMPTAVFIQQALLSSLPQREMLSGFAEMIKHGLIANASHLDNALREFSTGQIPSDNTIRESVNIKSAIVSRDPLEQGERKLLNFGHTIGHGIESYLSNDPNYTILHGEAIAIGMIAEMYISSQLLKFPSAEINRFRKILQPLISQVALNKEMIPDILEKIANDKKNEGQEIGMTLLNQHGGGVWGKTVSKELIEKSLLYIIE